MKEIKERTATRPNGPLNLETRGNGPTGTTPYSAVSIPPNQAEKSDKSRGLSVRSRSCLGSKVAQALRCQVDMRRNKPRYQSAGHRRGASPVSLDL